MATLSKAELAALDGRMFLDLLGQSLQTLFAREPRATYTVAVKLHVENGSPVAASVGYDAERETGNIIALHWKAR